MANPTFEESIAAIDKEIFKRRSKWTMTALAWMDFEDVAQILRIHIHKKWDLYRPTEPLLPWVNRVITNQIRNLVRNNYSNFSRPCLRCAAARGEDECVLYEKQCSVCPLYKKWEGGKKSAFNCKLPVSLENHLQEVHSMMEDTLDIEKIAVKIHAKMKEYLKPNEYKIYEALYIKFQDEEDIAKELGLITKEKSRQPGHRTLANAKKKIITRIKELLRDDEIDFY